MNNILYEEILTMKRSISVLSAIIVCTLCAVFTSCGSATIKGDPVSYYNADKSFSIDLPTASERSWVTDEETDGSVLDITDKSDTVNIQVQCLSKSQTQHVASDLASYEDYSLVNTLSDILPRTELEGSEADVPEFITGSTAYEFSLSDGVQGTVVFMESDKCYYTYLIMAVDEAYSSNRKALLESITSLKEITEVSGEVSDTDEAL